MMNRSQKQRGFTLVELITAVVLMSIISTLGGLLIIMPARSFSDVARRAELVDIADNALQLISRELRNAVPNSIRIRVSGTATAIEFLNTSTGGRYRAKREDGGSEDPLSGAGVDSFEVLDGVIGTINPGPAGQPSCLNGNADCLVIYNTGTGVGNFNAYNGDNIATITAATATSITYNNTVAWSFPFPIPPSASQRFFVVDRPISFVCDSGTGEIRRYEDYGINPAQPITAAEFGVAGRLLATNVDPVQGCVFGYTAGVSARQALVTLRVSLRDAATNESVALLYQVHVLNVP